MPRLRQNDNQLFFTLVELVIVFSIIVVLTITISGGIVDSSSARNVESDVATLVARITEVRSHAISDDVNAGKHGLRFSLDNDSTKVFVVGPDGKKHNEDAAMLTSEVVFSNRVGSQGDAVLAFSAAGSPLHKNGTLITKPVVITVSQSYESEDLAAKSVTIYPYTGFVEVTEVTP